MIELLTFISAGFLLISCVFPSLISLSVEVIPRSLKSASFFLTLGAVVIFGSNAVAG
jgi:hypothetical protein